MTIREVIELVTAIFKALMEYLAPLFEGKGDDESAEGEGTEA